MATAEQVTTLKDAIDEGVLIMPIKHYGEGLTDEGLYVTAYVAACINEYNRKQQCLKALQELSMH